MGLILIAPSDESQKRLVARGGPAAFSAAFDSVLAKHGFLDVRRVTPEQVAEIGCRDAIVLVAALPPHDWTDALVEHLARSGSPLLVEGPLPPDVSGRLGFPGQTTGRTATVLDASDGSKIGLGAPSPREAPIVKPAWECFPARPPRAIPERMGDVLYRLCHTLLARVAGRNASSEEEVELTLTAAVLALEKLPEGPSRRDFSARVEKAATAAQVSVPDPAAARGRLARLVSLGETPTVGKPESAFRYALSADEAEARDLVAQMLADDNLDLARGFVRAGSIVNGRWATEPATRWTHSPWLALLLCRVCDRISDVRRGSDDLTQLWPQAVLSAWRQPPRIPEGLATGSALAEGAGGEGAYVVRAGNRILLHAPLMTLAAYEHTVAPRLSAVRYLDNRNAIAIEAFLMRQIEALAADGGRPQVRVRPWPEGAAGCLTIRHDVDRLPPPEEFDSLLEWEVATGLGVSWYWIPDRIRPDWMKRVEVAGLENGLHSVKVMDKSAETALLDSHLSRQVKGECTHQGGGSDEWLGIQQLTAARRCGYSYVITQFSHAFPFRMLGLSPEGVVGVEDGPWCLSYVSTVDKPVTEPERMRKGFRDDLEWYRQGFHTIISNHPDINIPWLKELEALFPREGRLNWTALQVAEWWSRTHDPRHIRVALQEGTLEVDCAEEITGVVVDLLGLELPPLVLNLPAGRHQIALET